MHLEVQDVASAREELLLLFFLAELSQCILKLTYMVIYFFKQKLYITYLFSNFTSPLLINCLLKLTLRKVPILWFMVPVAHCQCTSLKARHLTNLKNASSCI